MLDKPATASKTPVTGMQKFVRTKIAKNEDTPKGFSSYFYSFFAYTHSQRVVARNSLVYGAI